MPMESRSITFVPEHERHGRVADQGPFWFLSNFHFFAIAIGFVGPSLGLGLGYTIAAGALGILIGTTFQAFHASQGAELGLPQMIQSRAQFGYRGVVVPLLAVFVSLVGYNVVATVILAEGLKNLWSVGRLTTALTISMLAGVLAIWGYDWLHRVFRILFWISLPLFALMSAAILLGKAGGITPAGARFDSVAFLTQLASAVSFNVTAAPYVSDYSRYLPTRTSRRAIIFHVFWGSAASAIWLVALGAWLATRMGTDDGLLALKRSGDSIVPGFGSCLAIASVLALVATVGMNAYSAMLTALTTADCLRPARPTQRTRIACIAGISLLWTVVALLFGGHAVTAINAMLVVMLYALMPWTAVNLIDYFFLRRGRYSIPDLFRPRGLYGSWGVRGLTAYAIGFSASVPFFVVPNVYTGSAAERLEGIDIGWLVGLAAAAAAYLALSRRFDVSREIGSMAETDQPPNTARMSAENS